MNLTPNIILQMSLSWNTAIISCISFASSRYVSKGGLSCSGSVQDLLSFAFRVTACLHGKLLVGVKFAPNTLPFLYLANIKIIRYDELSRFGVVL